MMKDFGWRMTNSFWFLCILLISFTHAERESFEVETTDASIRIYTGFGFLEGGKASVSVTLSPSVSISIR